MLGRAVTPWLMAELPGLGVCGEQKGEARIQQDAPGSCITHGAVGPLKSVRKIPLAEKCPSAVPAAPCTVQDSPIPTCPSSWKISLPVPRSGHLLGIHVEEDRASSQFPSPCSRGKKEKRCALAWEPRAPRGCEAEGSSCWGLAVGSCEEKGQQNTWHPRSSPARGLWHCQCSLLHTGCLSGS